MDLALNLNRLLPLSRSKLALTSLIIVQARYIALDLSLHHAQWERVFMGMMFVQLVSFAPLVGRHSFAQMENASIVLKPAAENSHFAQNGNQFCVQMEHA